MRHLEGRLWSAPRGAAAPAAAGVAAGSVTCACYLVGSGRSYDYDSSVTVGSFVATRSLLDPFRRQLVYNNHPLFSFLDHLVWSAGGHSPRDLRLLPILFGAAAVALVVWWCARRFGVVAAAGGGVVLAANPTFAELSRSVRGYSLLTLCAVGSTMLLEPLSTRPRRSVAAGYVVAVAAGLATHAYMLLVLLAQALVVVACRWPLRPWIVRWAAALALAGLAYAEVGGRMLRSARRAGELFRPRFPLELLTALLGGSRLTLLVLGTVVLFGVAALRSRSVAAAAVAVAVGLLAVWLWLSPLDLYPRFFIWLAPALAVAVAAGVRRLPVVALPFVAVAAVVMVRADRVHWTENPLPDRQAAQLVEAVRNRGGTPCVLPLIRGSLVAYVPAPREVRRPVQLRRCQLVLGLAADPRTIRDAARRRFEHRWELPAWTPMTVFSQLPEWELDGEPHRGV